MQGETEVKTVSGTEFQKPLPYKQVLSLFFSLHHLLGIFQATEHLEVTSRTNSKVDKRASSSCVSLGCLWFHGHKEWLSGSL